MASELVTALMSRGVIVPWPELVAIASDVAPDRIEPGVHLLPGVHLEGPRTRIGRGARLGTGGPVVVRDCGIGRHVELASGTFEGSVFLDGAVFGPSAQARSGTLMEEGASAAHAVGTKQTILLPFATLGSNINFCDALLAGGTGPKDHSEVGSGFIHFNFTPFGPAGDKATASLFGDVVRGAWLRERRIFLGGAGGVVGPVTIGFGTVLAAGSVYRRDRGENLLVAGETRAEREVEFDPRMLRRVAERVAKGLGYLAQLAALRAVYADVRRRLAGPDAFQQTIIDLALRLLDDAAGERVRQLERLAGGLPASVAALEARLGAGHPEAAAQRRIAEILPREAAGLRDIASRAAAADAPAREAVLASIPQAGSGYVDWVRKLPPDLVATGRKYLGSVAEAYRADVARTGLLA